MLALVARKLPLAICASHTPHKGTGAGLERGRRLAVLLMSRKQSNRAQEPEHLHSSSSQGFHMIGSALRSGIIYRSSGHQKQSKEFCNRYGTTKQYEDNFATDCEGRISHRVRKHITNKQASLSFLTCTTSYPGSFVTIYAYPAFWLRSEVPLCQRSRDGDKTVYFSCI